jgi:hypothetical protein
MRRVLADVPGASATTLLLALVLWFGLFLKADAFSPLDLFQPQQSSAPSQQSSVPSQQSDQRSDAALFDLFRPQPGAQGLDVSSYANDTNSPRVYRVRRYLRHARHHRREHPEEAGASSASDSNASSGASPTMPVPDAEPMWNIATSPTAMRPGPTVVSTFQIVIITQDGGDPFERCMTAYYWSRLNHALQADQIFDPAQRYAVDATSTDVTSHLAASWIEKSVGR